MGRDLDEIWTGFSHRDVIALTQGPESIMMFYQNEVMIVRLFFNGHFDSFRLLPNQRISHDAGGDGDCHIYQADDNRPPE